VYVTRVIVDGIRGFSHSRAVDLDLSNDDGGGPGWTVLAGRNGSGKTTLLRAIVLALAGPTRSNQLLTESDLWISLDSRRARSEVQVSLDPRYDIPPTSRDRRVRDTWLGVEWTSPISQRQLLEDRTGITPELKATASRRKNYSVNTAWAGKTIWSELPRGYFYAAYGPFRRLTGAGTEAQRLMLAPIPLSRIASLFREDASLVESVRWLQEQYFRQLESRAGAGELVDGVIALLNDGLMPDELRVERVDSDGLWVEREQNSLPLQQLSDGYRTAASLATDLIRSLASTYTDFAIDYSSGHPRVTYPGVVLIDEIDVHLHISWQQRIGPWLKQHFPNIQFIVTSHSPYVCQSASERGLVRMPGPSESGGPRRVDEQLYRRIIHGTGDDAVTSELFGVDTLYESNTRQMRHRLAFLEGKLALGQASDGEEEEYRRLRTELASSPLSRVRELGEADQ
jgi:energy-coupling factor transporter ATP-binding protein EcfA2